MYLLLRDKVTSKVLSATKYLRQYCDIDDVNYIYTEKVWLEKKPNLKSISEMGLKNKQKKTKPTVLTKILSLLNIRFLNEAIALRRITTKGSISRTINSADLPLIITYGLFTHV